LWDVCGHQAKKVVLCTGASDEIVKEAYLTLRRIYGQRCEVRSSTQMKATVHHEVSVSATKKNGRIAIGASHYLNEEDIPLPKEGAQALIDLARKSVRLEDIEIENIYCGMRSGSNDYFPILGPLVDSQKSLDIDSAALQGDKTASVVNYPELYMINGVGGYGFVLAPYLADQLSRYLVDAEPLAESLMAKRFYYRWAKKEGQL
jgi:tRNA 5-methylaminomethyl-2-thiouridine biosynthesis bifunctional protein